MALHILQGDTENDKRWLEKAARLHLSTSKWIVPSSAVEGDKAVIFVGSTFFATATIASTPKRRTDWPNRYGAGLRSVRLIEPPISLDVIRRRIPELKWAIYPRSVTTVLPAIATTISELISDRRHRGGSDVDDRMLDVAGIEELRARAIADARPKAARKVRMAVHQSRSLPVHRYVLARADGGCEGCRCKAPFQTRKMTPYLEPHHTIRLADDIPLSVIALCPTCHRRVHHSLDGEEYNAALIRKLRKLEPVGAR
ncbi:HNH endonuclease signature motif containing protein [Bradyrhizobium sp. NAS80.1]|uniref:HNH endonuclease signature motif containing protein n=1 Tax=Bradyrhizobium sp. NAS80.1 TaxID=1680159 RepID=UPI001160EB8C|nr:HNH endonuclease signature motif containing protein [Bradyrhizobium sp. NAS80.1]